MITSGVIFAFIGTLLFEFTNSAAIDYEPIKIIVNENFNAQPGQVSSELQAIEPGVLHQGANFYFKPQVNLPQNFIPSHIEALISFIQQHQNSCSKDPSKFAAEKDKLMEILKPFMNPSLDITKESPSKIVFEKENNLGIVKPPELIPPALEEIVTEPQAVPAVITEEPKPVAELLVIPEAPILPPLSLSNVHSLPEEEVKTDESALLEKQTGVYPTIPEITVRPIQEPIFTYVQTKPMTSELVNIPEAPILPSWSFNGIPSSVKKEIIKEESVITEAQRKVFPIISGISKEPIQESIINYVEPKLITTEIEAIPEAPVLPLLTVNDIKLVEAGMNIEEPLVSDVESKPVIQELEKVIPEAPVLFPLVLQDVPSILKEEVRKEESELLKEPTGAFPTVPEDAVRPVQEQVFNYAEPKPFITKLQVIPKAPALLPLSSHDIELVEEGMKIEGPVVVDVESEPATLELEEVIPEAPVLSPLVLQDAFSIVKEEMRKEESELLKEPTGVFSIIPEAAVRPVQEPIFDYAEPKPFISELQVIPEAPVLPPLSANDIKLIEEGMKVEEPIFVDVDSKLAVQELEEVIPKAPVLPPLSLPDVPDVVKEELRKEESELLKEPTGVFSTVPEATVWSVQEPLFNYAEPKPFISELQVIPEAPVLPPLSANDIKLIEEEGMKVEEPIFVDVESKLAVQELEEVIPKAPVFSPLSLPDFPDVVKEELRKEESELLKEPTGVFSTVPEATVWSVQEPLFNYAEPKPFNTKLQVIPEAPALPPLSANDIKLVEEGMKIKEPIVLDVESKPTIQELEEVIPKAPVLPPLSLPDVPYIVKEEVRKEESELMKEPTGVFSTVPEAAVRPVQKPIFDYAKPKPFISELQIIPEAPVLPPLSANDIKFVEEGMKFEEPIVLDVDSKPAIQELEEVIPKAPVLPRLSLPSVPYIVKEEMRKEESELLKEPTGVFPTVPEAAVWALQEPIFNYAEPKPFISELQVIPEAPVLSPLSANEIEIVEEGMKVEVPIFVDVDSKPAVQELEEVIPKGPVLPPLSLPDVPYIVKEEVRKEESELLKEPTGVFSTVPEATVWSVQEPISNYAEPKPFITKLQVIPEAPVLPPLSANDIKLVEDAMKIEEPIVLDVESKPAIQELEEVIPEAPVLYDVPYIVKEEVRNEEPELLKEPTGVFSIIPEAAVRPTQEPIFDYAEPKPYISELQVIPEPLVLSPLSTNSVKLIESGVKIEEPIDIIVDPELATELEIIPEAPILPPVSNIPLVEDVLSEEMTTVAKSTDRPSILGFFEKPIEPQLVTIDVETKPIKSNHIVISEAPILPGLPFNGKPSVGEEVKTEETIKIYESTDMFTENSARPISELKHFVLENNNSPVARKVNIEIPILLEESIEVFPPIAERPSEQTLEPLQELKMTNSNVLENVSQLKPEHVVQVKEALPPRFIPRPSNNLGVFSSEPFLSHLSNRTAKFKKLTMPKRASLERFLVKKHPFRLPITSFPKLSLNAMKSPIRENKKQFLYTTSYANDVVENRIAPGMGFKKYAPPKLVKIYVRSQVPKGPSYL